MTADPYYVRYDYAWTTPGWSAQNPVINYGTNGYVDPGLPEDIARVRVQGRFIELSSGRPLEGVLRLRVRSILTHLPTNQQIIPGAFKPIRFKRGYLDVSLPASNDPQLSPSFVYEARLTVGGTVREFTFELDYQIEDPVDINDLISTYDIGNPPLDTVP